MPTLNGSYILKASQAPTAVIEGRVYALLIEEERPENWVITPVGASEEGVVIIQTSDRSKAWTVPSNEAEEQITVQDLNSNLPAPNQIFRIVWPEPDSEYHIQLLTNNSPGYSIGRYPIEDLSLLPKRIVTLQKGLEIPLWLVEPAK
jgi:hypothetical protein